MGFTKFVIVHSVKCVVNHHPAVVVVKNAVKVAQELNKLENTDLSTLDPKKIALHELEKSVDKQLADTGLGKAVADAKQLDNGLGKVAEDAKHLEEAK